MTKGMCGKVPNENTTTSTSRIADDFRPGYKVPKGINLRKPLSELLDVKGELQIFKLLLLLSYHA